jgi:hypothetical protein
MAPSNEYIENALRLARELIELADEGEAASEDDGCRCLYGEVRDCAYRIRARADRERRAHREKGRWDGN